MRNCYVCGKIFITLFSAYPLVNVHVHLGEGKGSSNTTTYVQDANSSILEFLILLISDAGDSMRNCCVCGKIFTALFSAHPPVNVQVHHGEGKGSSNTAFQFQDANSIFLDSKVFKYLFADGSMRMCCIFGKITTALF